MPLSERSSFDDTWNEMDILTSSNDAGYSPASASQEEEGEGEGEKRTEVFKSDSFMEIDSLITGVSSRKDTLLEDGEGDASVPLEVKAIVGETDDPSLPVLTFRFWVISTFLTITIAAAAQFFFFRLVGLSLSAYIIQMVSYPIGTAMAKYIPRGRFNPGPFNRKEHTLICIAASTATSSAYAIDILTVQRIYYKQNIGALASLLLLWTTQCLGYGMAGFLREYLVKPPKMVWPIILPNVAVFNTLHGGDSASSAALSRKRYKFFFTVLIFTTLYQLLPNFFAPVLTWVSVICIAGGRNLSSFWSTLAGGVSNGGFLNISLDWSAVGGRYPLYAPLWAQMNEYLSTICFNWIFIPVLYYFNVWGARHYPMFGFLTRVPLPTNGNNSDIGLPSFFNNATANMTMLAIKMVDGYPQLPRFNASEVLFANLTLNEDKYKTYGPMLMSPWWAIGYGTSFGALTATISHVSLFHGKEIWMTFRNVMSQRRGGPNLVKEDIHTKLMNAYPEVPTSWYASLFLLTLTLSIFTVEYVAAPLLQLRWWGILLAVFIATCFVLPVGVLRAVTGSGVGLNVLTEMIIGFILPGQPIANVVFKTYGYMAMSQCLSLIGDQKLGHYMKTPPRALFVAQLFGTVLGSITNYSVMELILSAVNFLDPKGDPQWSARSTATFYTASLIWGAVGPEKLFGLTDGYYKAQLIWFLIGALLPVPVWICSRIWPKSNWKYVNVPIILISTLSNIGGAHMILTAMSVAIWSHWYMKKYKPTWYKNFNYVLGAGLDTGTTLSVVVGFLLIKLPGFRIPNWFLNPTDTPDYCYNSVQDR